MKFTVEIDPEINPDAVGEYLRSSFFDEKVINKKHYPFAYRVTGCYSTFGWQKDVEKLEPVELSSEDGGSHEFKEFWTCGKKTFAGETVECRWYWDDPEDGDGEIQFLLPNGKRLININCKKDYGWFLTDSLKET